MTKRKLQRFAENELAPNVFQPKVGYPPVDHEMKGHWNERFFKNNHPLVLELGCGRGEYTVNLAEMFPQKNYIGIDFKGARLWRGSKTALEKSMQHVAFLRIEIERAEHFFGSKEVDEIWITFPDPHPQKSRERKRLTSPRFLMMYKKLLKKGGIVHLKTDNRELYEYTLEEIKKNNFTTIISTPDLYSSTWYDEVLQIQTTYEHIFVKQGFKICYLKFSIQ
jgi:tRNA (guanine-N7-)-methyltransferase